MRKIFATIFLLSLIHPEISLAKGNGELNEEESLGRYYQNLFLGEKKTNDYFGPLDPRTVFNEESGDLQTLDDQFKNHYLNNETQPEALDVHNFWFKKIIEKSTCPDLTLGQNIDYIRYVYRLLSISYLFESLKVNSKLSRELGFNKSICSLSFDAVFGKCKTKSDDMKKFHERVYGKFVNEISKINVSQFDKKEMATWLLDFQHSTSLSTDPALARLHDWCHLQKKNCRNLSIDELKKALTNICSDDQEIITNLCSEQDNLYGISYAEKATELIESSNAFNLINRSGMGEDCLRRYVKIFAPKEVRYNSLSRQFPIIYSELLHENKRYLQGELFLPGALKEFDMKGLGDFLTALKPPKIESKVVITVPKAKVQPQIKPTLTIAVRPIPAPKPEAVKMVIEPPKPVISEFERAFKELSDKKLDSLFIDMDIFRDDFEFTQQMISNLSAPIKKFQTRAALTDMKSYDNLGSIDAPVGLIFLKYLIDTENHQGLYNIITVLGNKFYVNNDIEKKVTPVYVELRNDSTTKNHWQIILLKYPKIETKK